MKLLLLIILLFIMKVYPQQIQLPLEKNNYSATTTYPALIYFIEDAAAIDSTIKIEYIAESHFGRDIPALKISSSEFGVDTSKLKVLVFAQQHGNEQSGKEACLLLLKHITERKLDVVLQSIDLVIIPQMNPDGSVKNERRNSLDIDLNRNHLILTEPETIGLHKLFNSWLPEMTLDVHEYYPYTDDWKSYGYIKMWDEQIGITTNPNVSLSIRDFSSSEFLPYIEDYLEDQGYTFNNYILGGPPGEFRMRHSTYDINDGRQSFGILNSFSLILEGLNGTDAWAENIERRSKAQAAAITAFLEFGSRNKEKIKNLVKTERDKLLTSIEGEKIAVRMEHVKGEKPLKLSLRSLYSGKDTIVTVEEYHTGDEILLQIEKPAAYLVPKSDSRFKDLLDNHGIHYRNYNKHENDKLFKYTVTAIDSSELEETMIADPKVDKKEVPDINEEEYYYVPINQLHSNMLVLALEPQSMLGIVVYDQYKDLLKENQDYPILRVERR